MRITNGIFSKRHKFLEEKRRSDKLPPSLSHFWLILVVIVIGRGCIFRPATRYPGTYFNQGTNAAWLGVDWVNASHTATEITTLAENLRERRIHTVFVFTSYLHPDGNFNSTYSYTLQFLQTLGATYPDLEVQAWLGLPLKYVRLSDAAVRQEIVEFCIELVQVYGWDGVHLDPEPIIDGDQDVLVLLDELRASLGASATISIAARRIWPIYPAIDCPLVGYVAWGTKYYQEIASRVDQIAVMIYDSALPLPILYRQWTRFQVIALSQTLHSYDVQLFIGVPTSEEHTWTHWPNAEQMESGLHGIVDGLNDRQAHPAAVTGVAIYPYWEASAEEWGTYEKLWLGTDLVVSETNVR